MKTFSSIVGMIKSIIYKKLLKDVSMLRLTIGVSGSCVCVAVLLNFNQQTWKPQAVSWVLKNGFAALTHLSHPKDPWTWSIDNGHSCPFYLELKFDLIY